METLLVLVFGWLLGLLGPAIVDRARRAREAGRDRRAIRAELSELNGVLDLAAFQAHKAAGRIDRAVLEWLTRNLQGDSSREGKSLLNTARVVSQGTDDEIAIATQLLATPGGQVMARPEFGITYLRSPLTAEFNG